MNLAEARRYRKSSDPAVRAQAERVLAAKRDRAKRVRPKPVAPGRTRAERRVEHTASTENLRAEVRERCGGRDEVTGEELGAAWEMHHVEGGGSRRSQQRPGNVLAVSWETHRRAHRGDLATLEAIAKAPTLDAEGRRAAIRRLEKVLEAKGRSAGRSDPT